MSIALTQRKLFTDVTPRSLHSSRESISSAASPQYGTPILIVGRPLSSERPATAPPSSSKRTTAAEKPRTVAATTTPTPTTATQPRDTGRAPYAAIAGSSREPIARDPRLKTRMDDHQEKCFDIDHRLLVKTPEPKQPILQQRPPKRQQEEDETANIRVTKKKLEGRPASPQQSDRPQSVAQSVASAFEPTTTMTASAQVVAPPKEQRLRKPKRLRSAGADITTHPEPSEVPVVAASSQRTKAKPATSDQAPTASEGTAAEILGKLIQAYHICHDGREGHQGAALLCTNGTLFNQEKFTCDWWYNVDCSQAVDHYR
ncbi:hypothetical protein ACJJTC_002007 [Scirpophaga incertulas]